MPTRKPVTAAEAYAAAATRAVHLAEGIVQHLVAVQDKIDPGDVDWADVGTMARMVSELETIAQDLRDYVDG